jgi:transketolase
MNLKKIELVGNKIKLRLFKKYAEIEQGHPGSVLSVFDIVNYIYTAKQINLKKKNIYRNKLIISKGHAASVIYPYLIDSNVIPKNEWENWGKKKSVFRIFSNTSIKGIDATSGSLGHGCGIAAGMALSNKANKNRLKIFTIISEGELYEGSIWESLLFLSHQKLYNVKLILDVNNLIILGKTKDCLELSQIDKKFQSFGFKTKTINGHDYDQIHNGFKFLNANDKNMKVLITNTVKGNGISFMENKPEWHYWQKMTAVQKTTMIRELDEKISEG